MIRRRGPAGRAGAVVVAVVAVAGLVAACGGRSGSTTTTTRPATSAPAPASTTSTVPYRSAVYSRPESWLCRPGLADDACDVDLDATLVGRDGSLTVQPFVPAADPAVDCFYVYPTISGDPPPNADMHAGAEERGVTGAQFARFGSVCRLFAPIYRQVPLAGLGAALGGRTTTTVAGTPAPAEVAYGDVLDAWRQYLAADNDGRPFVLVGHSQGASILRRLVAEQIDGNEALRRRMVSALLIGAPVPAPGSPGAFRHVPPCAGSTSGPDVPTGCVVTYSSFASTAPPPADSLFGRPRGGKGRAVCTNPATLAPGVAPLDSYFSGAGKGVSTPWVRYEGLVTGECTSDATFDWLRITSTWTPGDARPEDLGGRLTPPWGLHLIDVNLAQGDLVDLVAAQARQPRS